MLIAFDNVPKNWPTGSYVEIDLDGNQLEIEQEIEVARLVLEMAIEAREQCGNHKFIILIPATMPEKYAKMAFKWITKDMLAKLGFAGLEYARK